MFTCTVTIGCKIRIACITCFVNGCEVAVTHIGTGVLIVCAMNRIAIQTISSTIDLVDNECRFYFRIGGWYSSRITTAIDLLDTGYFTAFDDNLSVLIRAYGLVGGQVATAIDGLHIIVV